MSRRELEDAIFQMQRLSLEAHVLPVVEEAARALADGKDLEAEALVEKAEALLRAGQQIAAPRS